MKSNLHGIEIQKDKGDIGRKMTYERQESHEARSTSEPCRFSRALTS